MKARIDPAFQKLLASFDEVNIEMHSSAVYGLWKDFSLAYFNPAWFAFAQDNGGEPSISEEWNLGRNVMEAVTSDLKEFYTGFFLSTFNDPRSQGYPKQHAYQCSSAHRYRMFNMTLYPVVVNQGILVVNSLVQEMPHPVTEVAREGNASVYTDSDGLIHQCSHCRKVKNLQEKNRWDWIPLWVRELPANIRQELCAFCLDYHYPRKSEA